MTLALDHFRAARPQRIALAGTELCYRTFGEGPAVLLIHGWPLSGITYRYLVEALKPHYRCIVPDLPGTGDTPWSPRITDAVADYANLMRALIDHLQLDRVALIGHDSGGGVARVVAADLGSRAACLILQNTEVPNHMPLMVRALKVVMATPAGVAGFSHLLRNARYRKSSLGFGDCFGDPSLVEGEFFEACIQPLLGGGVRGHIAMLSKLDLGWTRRLPAMHARITAPIHLFWGSADKFFPLERAQSMRAEFARPGELEVVPNAKLYVHEEAPEALAHFSLRHLQAAFAPGAAGHSARLPS